MVIKIKDVRFSYGSKEILRGVDVHIQKGKLTGILGPNGCGKSTLLKNMLGYLKKDSGEIYVGNKELGEFNQRELAKRVALVPQKSSLSSSMKVEEFVLMGRLPHLSSNWSGYSREDKNISEKNLEELELKEFKERGALSLSGGEFQRVLLARALTQEPEILLLDEPTSAMDLNHAVELMSKVKRLVKGKNLTSITVVHDLNLASMFCDELILLKDGVVAYKGTPKEVLTVEILKEVYNLECHIVKGEDEKPYIIPKIKEV